MDLNCEQIEDKLELLGYSTKDAVEITLLCSNFANHIKGLTFSFLNYIINSVIRYYKPSCKHIFLTVSQGSNNEKALQFYKSFGFQEISNSIMIYTYKGGKKNKNKKNKSNKQKRYKRTHKKSYKK